tara:strand:- start:6126 stop:6863 length:738 start_codon:yes stop_codon:yes gene_type:complete
LFDSILVIILAGVLSSVHFGVVYFSKLEQRVQSIISSIGGGVSLGYIFLHVLPELAIKGNKIAYKLQGDPNFNFEIIELSFFFVALLGLLLLFILDVLSDTLKISRKFNFSVHLIYNTVVSYLYAYALHEVVKEGLLYSLLYTITLSTHLFASDRMIIKYHEEYYKTTYKWISFSAVYIGLINSYRFPQSELALEYAYAFITGGVLLNTFFEELPKKSLINIKWFLSAVLITGIEILVALFLKYN